MATKFQLGIVAPSSKVGQVELGLGIQTLREKGFAVRVHPQCKKSSLFFAGTDQERAEALYEYAQDPNIQAIWTARGGYGAIRLLPILDQLVRERGIPKVQKLLLGYSDVTVLMEYVRKRWGWATLHAPVPGFRKFSALNSADWKAMGGWIRKQDVNPPWAKCKLQFWNSSLSQPLVAPMVGGNLTIWTSLLGTPYQPEAKGKLVFLEDVDESLYRVDRMLQQLILSGTLSGIRGIVLGNFMNCRDVVSSVLKKVPREAKNILTPRPTDLKPLRAQMKEGVLLKKLFSDFGARLGVPVVHGLPVGHGPEVSPLPLGAEYRLNPDGRIEIVNWDWLDTPRQKA